MAYNTGDRFKRVADELFDGSIGDLAQALEMKPGSFSKYTAGKVMPGGNILKRLIDLDINLNWFLSGIPPMRISQIRVADISHHKNFTNEEGPDYFKDFDTEELSDAEELILSEVKHFSSFLDSRPLHPRIKRIFLELLIRSIDRAVEQREHDPDHDENNLSLE